MGQFYILSSPLETMQPVSFDFLEPKTLNPLYLFSFKDNKIKREKSDNYSNNTKIRKQWTKKILAQIDAKKLSNYKD